MQSEDVAAIEYNEFGKAGGKVSRTDMETLTLVEYSEPESLVIIRMRGTRLVART